jgi:nucleoside-diphosphate-sugar epimerase
MLLGLDLSHVGRVCAIRGSDITDIIPRGSRASWQGGASELQRSLKLRALITGAAGFIGSHIAEALVGDGHEVVGFDDLSEGAADNLVPQADLRVGDVRELDAVLAAARGVDVIFHEAAIRSVSKSIEAPALTTEVNVGGTLNVLLAAQEVGARVVYAASSSAYGDQEEYPVREDMEPRPRSPYAASKLTGELYCQTWWRSFGVPTVSLRYFNAYGPRQSPRTQYAAVVPLFIEACLGGTNPTIHGDGEQSRDFTYIEDVVEANLRAAAAPEAASGTVVNVGGGRAPTTINRILAILAELTGAHPEPVQEPPRPGDIRQSQADVSRAAELIGYQPKVDIEEGLRRTVEWFREARVA